MIRLKIRLVGVALLGLLPLLGAPAAVAADAAVVSLPFEGGQRVSIVQGYNGGFLSLVSIH